MAEDNASTKHVETRRLAAIMFTDIVGFSRQMGADEARMLRLLDVHNRIIRQAVTAHHGTVIILALQDEIAQKIVTTLKLQLTLQEQGYLVRKRTDNPDAYDVWMQGLAFFVRSTKETNQGGQRMPWRWQRKRSASILVTPSSTPLLRLCLSPDGTV